MLSTTVAAEKLDPRVRRTRQSLEQAFLDVLKEKGFQAVTVRDITARAGVNRATFYAHFDDKYALLDYSIRQGFRQVIEKRMLNACHYSRENLRHLIIAVCEYTRGASAHCKPPQGQFESLVETQVKSVLYDLLTNWLKQARPDVSPETAATAGSWAIYGLVSRWNHSAPRKPAEQFADEVLPLVAANLKVTQTV